jgi:hypothetical protein
MSFGRVSRASLLLVGLFDLGISSGVAAIETGIGGKVIDALGINGALCLGTAVRPFLAIGSAGAGLESGGSSSK